MNLDLIDFDAVSSAPLSDVVSSYSDGLTPSQRLKEKLDVYFGGNFNKSFDQPVGKDIKEYCCGLFVVTNVFRSFSLSFGLCGGSGNGTYDAKSVVVIAGAQAMPISLLDNNVKVGLHCQMLYHLSDQKTVLKVAVASEIAGIVYVNVGIAGLSYWKSKIPWKTSDGKEHYHICVGDAVEGAKKMRDDLDKKEKEVKQMHDKLKKMGSKIAAFDKMEFIESTIVNSQVPEIVQLREELSNMDDIYEGELKYLNSIGADASIIQALEDKHKKEINERTEKSRDLIMLQLKLSDEELYEAITQYTPISKKYIPDVTNYNAEVKAHSDPKNRLELKFSTGIALTLGVNLSKIFWKLKARSN